MHTIDIYRGASKFVTIKPDESSVQVKKVMGENELRITFTENHFIDFKLGDSCAAFGELYKINRPPVPVKNSSREYEFTLVMQAEGFDLGKTQFLFYDAANLLTQGEFSLMGNANNFIDLVVANANRVSNGWTKGQVINTAYENLTFSKENCYNALSRIAETFGTEFWIMGKTIHLTKIEKDTGYLFKHGELKGLYQIQRSPITDVATRLYAFGSEKNLPPDYRNYSKRLMMNDSVTPVSGVLHYLEKNVSIHGLIEQTEIFEDVYPRRTGKVTSVNASNFYEFLDTAIDFDVNAQLLPGLAAKVVFNTGQLAGYEFEVAKFNNTTKAFTILKNKNERVLDIPSNLLKPAIGDEYVLVDIKMPDAYIAAAEDELKAKAQDFLDELSTSQYSYRIVIDPVFIKRKNYSLNIGDAVWIKDVELDIDRKIRITSTSRGIVDEYSYQVDLADVVTAGTLQTLVSTGASNARDIDSITRDLQNFSLLNNNVIGDLKVKQGSIIFENLPTTTTTTGFSQVYMENGTGKLYRKI